MEYALDQFKGSPGSSLNGRPAHVACLFGTRPEVIKFAPVIRALKEKGAKTCIISSAQHTDLLLPLIKQFGIRVDHNLKVMRPNQTLDGISARVLERLGPVLASERPDALLVQGDTTTAMAGAMAAFHAKIPVGHIEAGLRSGNPDSPFPEEMNRRLITKLARLHFAATRRNADSLIAEGVHPETIFQTGNPVIDSLLDTIKKAEIGSELRNALMASEGTKRIILTTHRRESFGTKMHGHLTVIRDFVRENKDTSLIFPVHPNPHVMQCAREILGGESRVWMTSPLPYHEFTVLLKTSWLIVSDSGGIQEEAPSLGKPLLIIRDNTERPEAVECGAAKLVGENSEELGRHLHEVYFGAQWADKARTVENPFGDGKAGSRIAEALLTTIASREEARV